MAFISDFINAIKSYPKLSVSLEIVDRNDLSTSPSSVINVNEKWSFRVRVHNNGELNLTNVILYIEGQNGVMVSKASPTAGRWRKDINSSPISVKSHSSQDTAICFMKAPANASTGSVPLLKVHVDEFNANLDHILNDHSEESDSPECVYSSQIYPL